MLRGPAGGECMSVRETLRKKPALGYAIVPIAIIAVIIGILRTRGIEPSATTSAYYSNDDGKTFFSDDANRIAPFMKNGAEADMAHVFRKSDGSLFVGYLEKVTPEAVEIIKRVKDRKPNDPPVPMGLMNVVLSGHLYKRPGDTVWVSGKDLAASNKVSTIKDASGKPMVEVQDD